MTSFDTVSRPGVRIAPSSEERSMREMSLPFSNRIEKHLPGEHDQKSHGRRYGRTDGPPVDIGPPIFTSPEWPMPEGYVLLPDTIKTRTGVRYDGRIEPIAAGAQLPDLDHPGYSDEPGTHAGTSIDKAHVKHIYENSVLFEDSEQRFLSHRTVYSYDGPFADSKTEAFCTARGLCHWNAVMAQELGVGGPGTVLYSGWAQRPITRYDTIGGAFMGNHEPTNESSQGSALADVWYHHSWLVTPDGTIIETVPRGFKPKSGDAYGNWEPPPSRYYGAPISDAMVPSVTYYLDTKMDSMEQQETFAHDGKKLVSGPARLNKWTSIKRKILSRVSIQIDSGGYPIGDPPPWPVLAIAKRRPQGLGINRLRYGPS